MAARDGVRSFQAEMTCVVRPRPTVCVVARCSQVARSNWLQIGRRRAAVQIKSVGHLTVFFVMAMTVAATVVIVTASSPDGQ